MAIARLANLLLLLIEAYLVCAIPSCGHFEYGRPSFSSCAKALSKLPQDKSAHLFVEQDLRAAPPLANWPPVADSRAARSREKVRQLPLFWSQGTCNIALLAYCHKQQAVTVGKTSWHAIFDAASSLVATCTAKQGKGGSAVVNDPQGNPALSIFLWEDGAQWDWLMNHYMNDPFPQPPDPSIVHGLFNNGSLVETFRKAMSARLEEIDA